MDDKARIAELEALVATLADKLADIAEKLRRCLDRKPRRCWREAHHLGRCGGGGGEDWADK